MRASDRWLVVVAACLLPSAGAMAQLALHIGCDAQTPPAQRVVLSEWFATPGRAATACVQREPAVARPALRSVGIVEAPGQRGVELMLELTDEARSPLLKATQANVGRPLAIVIGGRIAGMPTIAGAIDRPRIGVHAPSVADAQALVRAIPWHGNVPIPAIAMTPPPPPRSDDVERWRPLQGNWTVMTTTVDGAPRTDAGANWRVAGDRLTVVDASGRSVSRYVLSDLDTASTPPAFQATPEGSGREKPRWIAYRREGDALQLASFEDEATRPTSFAPGNKLVLLTLWPAARAVTYRKDAVARICPAVADAARDVLDATLTPVQRPGALCAFESASARVSAAVVPITDADALQAHRLAFERETKGVVQSEPSLGPGAFSLVSPGRRAFAMAADDSLLVLTVELAGTPERARELAARVKRRL